MWWTSPTELFKDMLLYKLGELRKIVRRNPKTMSHEQCTDPRKPPGREEGIFIYFPLCSLALVTGSPGILRGKATINKAMFHVEAIEVTDKNGIQEATTESGDMFLHELPYADGAFQTVEHEGKQYVLHIFPHMV